MRLLKKADPFRPALMIFLAEELLLHQVWRNIGRVHNDERPIMAIGLRVNEAAGKLLACTGWPGDQNA